jgi:Ca2+-transporting ATPase
MSQPDTRSPWHARNPEELAAEYGSSLQEGLPQTGIAALQERHGINELKAAARKGPLMLFLSQFNQPLVYILLVAVLVTLFLHEYVDSAVILAVVLINAAIGFLQESKAEAAIEALSRLVVTEAAVRRDGQWGRVNSRELVPGDVVALQSGDKVPADLRLFKVRDLRT